MWGETLLLDKYQIVVQIGEGTYGQVFKAIDKQSNHLVALKKIRMDNEKEGFPITALREIKILKQLNHPSIVYLREIVSDPIDPNNVNARPDFYMVFEYMDHDLRGLIDSNLIQLSSEQIGLIMKQLLQGLNYCHSLDILHRDIKGSNLLVNNKGEVKIADFGLARRYDSDEQRGYTNQVITLWYRPPELLLGVEKYGPEVDIWSIGCILGELFFKKPILKGVNDFDQLDIIFHLCGTPTPSTWPAVTKTPLYETAMPKKSHQRHLQSKFKSIMSPEALDLLEKMLCLDPTRRITARTALSHPFVNLDPTTVPPIVMPSQDCHEMYVKNQRKGLPQPVPLINVPAAPTVPSVSVVPTVINQVPLLPMIPPPPAMLYNVANGPPLPPLLPPPPPPPPAPQMMPSIFPFQLKRR